MLIMQSCNCCSGKALSGPCLLGNPVAVLACMVTPYMSSSPIPSAACAVPQTRG
jgi:hypothetical protein